MTDIQVRETETPTTNTLTFVGRNAETFCRAVVALAVCASNDDSRPFLTKINVKRFTNADGQEVARLAASDSYRLGVVDVALGDMPNVSPSVHNETIKVLDDTNLDAKSLAKFCKDALKTLKKNPQAIFEIDLGTDYATATTEGASVQIQKADGDYPNYPALFPDVAEHSNGPTAFNPAFIGDIHKITKAFTVGTNNCSAVRLMRTDPLKPCIWEFGGGDLPLFTYLIMPVRIT